MTETRNAISNEAIEAAGQWFAVLVVLAPVTGAAMRWVAFLFDPTIPDALRTAINAPLQELIATSAGAVVPAVALLLILTPLLMAGSSAPGDPPPTTGIRRIEERFANRFATRRGLAVVLGFLALIAPPHVFASMLASLFAGIALGGFAATAPPKRTAFQVFLPAIAIIAFGSVVSGGLGLSLPATDWTFDDASGLTSGRYVEIGTANDRVVLRSCASGMLVEVPTSAIRANTPIAAPGPLRGSVLGMVLGRAPVAIGIAYHC